jgi:hypothetical protein
VISIALDRCADNDNVHPDNGGGGDSDDDAGDGAGEADPRVPGASPVGPHVRDDTPGGPLALGLRRPSDRPLHPLRHQDPERPGELQRGQVHRLRHVHDLRYLDRLRAHILRKRDQGESRSFKRQLSGP